jgi:hypothetical protein
MIDRYLIETRDKDRGNWMTFSTGNDTPTSKNMAAYALVEAQEVYGPTYEYRVTLLDWDTNGFAFVTESIEALIEEQQAEEAKQAQEDAAHIRQESMRGVFV